MGTWQQETRAYLNKDGAEDTCRIERRLEEPEEQEAGDGIVDEKQRLVEHAILAAARRLLLPFSPPLLFLKPLSLPPLPSTDIAIPSFPVAGFLSSPPFSSLPFCGAASPPLCGATRGVRSHSRDVRRTASWVWSRGAGAHRQWWRQAGVEACFSFFLLSFISQKRYHRRVYSW